MIDALVIYIESKGFNVHVMYWSIFIYTFVDGEIIGWRWSIFPGDVRRLECKDGLFGEADYILYQLTEAIIKEHKKEFA